MVHQQIVLPRDGRELWKIGMQGSFVLAITQIITLFSKQGVKFAEILMVSTTSLTFLLVFCRLYFGDTKLFLLESKVRFEQKQVHLDDCFAGFLLVAQATIFLLLAYTAITPEKFFPLHGALMLTNTWWLVLRLMRYRNFIAKVHVDQRQNQEVNRCLDLIWATCIWIGNNCCCGFLGFLVLYCCGMNNCTLGITFLLVLASSIIDLRATWFIYSTK